MRLRMETENLRGPGEDIQRVLSKEDHPGRKETNK
jgi:hypothetical protein